MSGETKDPISEFLVTMEDLSNALNGTLGQVALELRLRHKFTEPQIQEIVERALAEGYRTMKGKQAKRKPLIEVVQ